MTSTDTNTASERITEELGSWPGVSAGPGRRGEFAFKVGHREIGHLHGDHSAHYFFPQEDVGRAERRRAGRAPPGVSRPQRTGGA